jgi:tetratricopeptide (TPR) repeat protein
MEGRDMPRSFDPLRHTLGLAVLAGALLAGDTVAAQSSRMRVLAPAFEVPDNPRSRLGERLADEVRKQINQMATHMPVDDRTVRDALRKHNLRAEEMQCVHWRQLAPQIDAALVLCGTVNESTGMVSADFWNLAGDAFEVPAFALRDPAHGAQQVVQAFGTYVRQLALLLNCNDYLQNQSWELALDQCNQAVELNPRSVTGHYGRGSALANLEQPEAALEAFRTVLGLDELNQDAMLHAGLLAAQLGRSDESQRFFQQYLELNPGNEQVRLKIATDLATAGDPSGALRLLEEVIQADRPSGLMLEYAGHFAFNAGARAADTGAPGELAEEAGRFFRRAIQHYDQAITVRGDSVDATVFRNLMTAHHRLGNTEQALQYGERAVQATPDDATTWLVYGDVLSGAKRLDDALRAFDRAIAINPELPNITARKALMLLEAGRIQDAIATTKAGLQRGDVRQENAEEVAQRIALRGFNLTQAGRHEEALPLYAAAREIGRSQRTVAMINFLHGYTLIRQAHPLLSESPNAAKARQARPMVERAKTLLEGAAAYTEQAPLRAQLIQQANQLLEVADALIKAGR